MQPATRAVGAVLLVGMLLLGHTTAPVQASQAVVVILRGEITMVPDRGPAFTLRIQALLSGPTDSLSGEGVSTFSSGDSPSTFGVFRSLLTGSLLEDGQFLALFGRALFYRDKEDRFDGVIVPTFELHVTTPLNHRGKTQEGTGVIDTLMLFTSGREILPVMGHGTGTITIVPISSPEVPRF